MCIWTHTDRHVNTHTEKDTGGHTQMRQTTTMQANTVTSGHTETDTHPHKQMQTQRHTQTPTHRHPHSEKANTPAVSFLLWRVSVRVGLCVARTDKTYMHRKQTLGLNAICECWSLSMCAYIRKGVCASLVSVWPGAPASAYACSCLPTKVCDCKCLSICVGNVNVHVCLCACQRVCEGLWSLQVCVLVCV